MEKGDNPKVISVANFVNLGSLMNLLDTNNRWVYKGSLTTPPCTPKVYWNVLYNVYPISQKHLDLLRAQLARNKGTLSKTGNWRVTQKIDKQNVIRVNS